MAICSIKLPGTMATQPRCYWADSTACRPPFLPHFSPLDHSMSEEELTQNQP